MVNIKIMQGYLLIQFFENSEEQSQGWSEIVNKKGGPLQVIMTTSDRCVVKY